MDDPLSVTRSASWRKQLARLLLAWFEKNLRDLPWRKNRDLYRIWISEIMLQQTQVVTVIDYFHRFVAKFPTVQDLARADEAEVLRLWEGLGYYRRARQLHAAAKKVAAEHQGKFPRDFEGVRGLPGVGRYTAGAILSIGLDQRLPILEANTIRVFSRLTAYAGSTTTSAGQKFLWQVAEELLPAKHVGAFNQALMELGSEICQPRAPKCESCPVANLCPTKEQGLQAEIPAAKQKTQYEDLHQGAVVIWLKEKVLLRQCQPQERWAGLWDFPRFDLTKSAAAKLQAQLVAGTASLTGLTIGPAKKLATLKHGVTKYRITLDVFATELAPSAKTHRAKPQARGGVVAEEIAIPQQVWLTPAELADYPLSVTGRKIAKLLLAP